MSVYQSPNVNNNIELLRAIWEQKGGVMGGAGTYQSPNINNENSLLRAIWEIMQ